MAMNTFVKVSSDGTFYDARKSEDKKPASLVSDSQAVEENEEPRILTISITPCEEDSYNIEAKLDKPLASSDRWDSVYISASNDGKAEDAEMDYSYTYLSINSGEELTSISSIYLKAGTTAVNYQIGDLEGTIKLPAEGKTSKIKIKLI